MVKYENGLRLYDLTDEPRREVVRSIANICWRLMPLEHYFESAIQEIYFPMTYDYLEQNDDPTDLAMRQLIGGIVKDVRDYVHQVLVPEKEAYSDGHGTTKEDWRALKYESLRLKQAIKGFNHTAELRIPVLKKIHPVAGEILDGSLKVRKAQLETDQRVIKTLIDQIRAA